MTDTQSQLELLHRDIRQCQKCVAAGYLPDAAPVVRGHTGQRLMIIGQAPGINAATTGLPWSGASGVVLAGWLEQIGIDPGTWREHCYLTSVTKCFPGKPPTGSGDRAPSRKEQALCRPFLDREVALVRPRWMITLGRIAAETMLPDLRGQPLTSIVGRVLETDLGYGPVQVAPLPHPSGVSRWLNDPANRALVDQALARFSELYLVR
jgi:uracil-DNA glycosylase family 4